ncbi:hypothetical protein ACC681_38320, partial [Rhizobium ruizarguesonis]
LAALAFPVSNFTFGDYQHAGGIALLSLAIFFRLVSAGQTAFIQGLRGKKERTKQSENNRYASQHCC